MKEKKVTVASTLPEEAKKYTSRELVEHNESSMLLFGRNIVKALNHRIVYTTALVNMYKTNITQLESSSLGRGKKEEAINKQTARLLAEQTFLEHYKDIRQNLYDSIDIIYGDKPAIFRKVFTSYFLDGDSIRATALKCKITYEQVSEILELIRDDYFDFDFIEQ